MKLNMSMDFVRPLAGSVKKYTALLPSVVITVVAILLFFPMVMIGKQVKDKMEQSKRTADSVRSLIQKMPSMHTPVEKERKMNEFQKQIDAMKQSAIQSSQRDLVTYDYVIFPEPTDLSSQIYLEFGDLYREAVEGLFEKINALDAPSDQEIRARTGGQAMPSGYRRDNINADNPIVDAFCLRRAKDISVYASPFVFKWYQFWENYELSDKNQALKDCWNSQVAFWIYEDVIDSIHKLNGTSVEVLSAPVKRLLGVSFTGPVEIESRDHKQFDRGGYGNRDILNYITPMMPSNFMNFSPTARTTDDDVDIIHFAVSLLLDHRSAMPFMKELCSEKPHTFYPDFKKQGRPVESRHNQISILQSDIKVIDITDSDHALYRYGKGAVVRLDLICEYQFDRQGYDMIKPKPVKKLLNQEESSDGGDQGPSSGPGAGMQDMMM